MTIYIYDRQGNLLGDDVTLLERSLTEEDRRVKYTVVWDATKVTPVKYHISTVFLGGLDHNWGTGEPLLFETMVFAKVPEGVELKGALKAQVEEWDQNQWRYPSEAQAQLGHDVVLTTILAEMIDPKFEDTSMPTNRELNDA